MAGELERGGSSVADRGEQSMVYGPEAPFLLGRAKTTALYAVGAGLAGSLSL